MREWDRCFCSWAPWPRWAWCAGPGSIISEFIKLPGLLGVFILALCTLVVLLQLPITLPLEHDASRRARQLVQEARLVGPGEQRAFEAMLRSAWLTYAAHQAQGCVYLATV